MESKKCKSYKGEKYIYLLMAYRMAENNNNYISIGEDNGCKGGQNVNRRFDVCTYKGKVCLTEIKTSSGFTDYRRVFEVHGNGKTPTIRDYINEDGENCGQRWTH